MKVLVGGGGGRGHGQGWEARVVGGGGVCGSLEKSMTVKPVTPPEWYPGHPRPKTHLHTCDMAPPSFWLDSDAPEPLSGETLAPLEKKQDLYVYSRYRRQKKVAMCKFLLGWLTPATWYGTT